MNATVCGATVEQCVCGLAAGHDGAHVCENTTACNGSWTVDDEGRIVPVRFPGMDETTSEGLMEVVRMMYALAGAGPGGEL